VREKISKAFLEKQKIVEEITANIKAAKSIIFMDYRGINVDEVTKLRVKLRKAGVVYKVYKNNLMKIALNNAGIKELDDKLAGTLAVAFSNNDEVSAAKIILDQKYEKKMAFKFGLLGKTVLDAEGIVALSKMPSKETLVAQLLALLQSPARNLATVINAVPRNLAVVVSERAKQLA
jgi:large subunit ribosomal protein L10